MACLLQGVGGVLQGFLSIYPAGLGGAHQDSGVGCPYWWWHGPIHPKYVLCGCSLATLQAAPSWRRCPVQGNQGLPEHSEVWRYCLGSGSYPGNAVWQMALRCFAKCPRIGRTVPLLKPPQSPHCYLGAVDHATKIPPTPSHTASPVLSR